MAEFDDEDEDLGLGDDEDKRRKPLEAAADAKLNPSIGTPIVAPPGQQAGPAAALATPKSIGTPITQEAPPDLGTGLTVPQSIGGVIAPESQPALPNRPTSADAAYQPNELHGWRKALGIASAGAAGGANPALGQEVVHNLFDQPKIDAQNKLKADQGAYDTEFNQGEKQRTDIAANDLKEALAKKAANPPPAPRKQYESIAQMHAEAVDDAIQRGVKPEDDPRVQQIESSIQRLQKAPVPHTPTFEEQTFEEWHKGHQDGTRLQFEKEMAANKRDPNEGSWVPMEVNGKPVRMNTKTGEIKDTTAEKPGTADRRTAAGEKAEKPYHTVIDMGPTAHQLADLASKGNAPADVDLALLFFKAIKGTEGTGIRYTLTEANQIQHARDVGSDLEAAGQKVIGEGQQFTPEQRAKMVTVIDLHSKLAQQALDRLHAGGSGGPAAPAGGPGPAAGSKLDDIIKRHQPQAQP